METTQTSQSLYQALWNSADVLRSKMDANDYKSYLLGMVFYKYLSDKMLFFVAETMEEETESLEEALAVYRRYYEDEEIWELRPLRDRILFVAWLDGSFVLLHPFVKKTQKTPRGEIEKAKRELQDLKERGLRDEE